MKKILIIVLGLTLGIGSCSKDSLESINPNAPSLESLLYEEGFAKAAYGVYAPLRFNSSYYHVWFVTWAHKIMGDATASHVGNFGIRWANQTAQIIRPNGQVVLPPVGGRQPELLNSFNNRDSGTDNVQAFEWFPAYGLIGHCNLLLSRVDDVEFLTGAEMKRNTYKAWLYWWKGFAYSRIGSIYTHGLIVNEYEEMNNNYVPRTAIIEEANRNFNLAKEILVNIEEDNAVYTAVMNALIPQQFKAGTGGLITPSMFIRNINTYMARNILVNKYAEDLTTADLDAIEELANSGILSTDKVFNARSASTNCFVYSTAWSPWRMNLAWEVISERLVQDFRPDDARKARLVVERAPAAWQINPAARGFQYSTRWNARSVAQGGEWQSQVAGAAEIFLAGSYEENQLMLAEAKLRRGQIDEGLAHIDAVRDYQMANLPATVGAGLTLEEALEELRIERRIALFKNSTHFYDARRWGVLRPLAQGGGRTNAIVVFSATEIEECTIEYDYKEWWDVPANETDFNPKPTSVASPGDIRPL